MEQNRPRRSQFARQSFDGTCAQHGVFVWVFFAVCEAFVCPRMSPFGRTLTRAVMPSVHFLPFDPFFCFSTRFSVTLLLVVCGCVFPFMCTLAPCFMTRPHPFSCSLTLFVLLLLLVFYCVFFASLVCGCDFSFHVHFFVVRPHIDCDFCLVFHPPR